MDRLAKLMFRSLLIRLWTSRVSLSRHQYSLGLGLLTNSLVYINTNGTIEQTISIDGSIISQQADCEFPLSFEL